MCRRCLARHRSAHYHGLSRSIAVTPLASTAGEKSCPGENRLGTCTKEKGTVTEIVYGGAPNNYSVSTAKNACEFKGGVFMQAPSAPK